MFIRGLQLAAALLAISIASTAFAGAADDIRARTAEAMESYDLLDYEAAKKGLSSALLLAKRKGLGDDPVAASVHVHLGVVYYSGFEDLEAARLEFANAIEIDPNVEIPKAYRTSEMNDLFEGLRADLAGTATYEPEPDGGSGGAKCDVIEGLAHEQVEESPAGSEISINLGVGADLEVAKVTLYYRADGKERFEAVTMGRKGRCEYYGAIPATATEGEVVHYYIQATNKRGKEIARSGSKGSPNIIEMTAPVAGSDEDPFAVGSKSEVSVEEEIEPTKPARVFLAVIAGSGGGYVTGETEKEIVPVACCFAPALFHLMPEVGYWLSTRTAMSLAVRLGFPVGANVEGHATMAPAGFLRIRHGFSDDGTGFQLTGTVGGGIIRHTVKVENAAPGQDMDTVATGPLILGAGAGYMKTLAGPLRLIAELHALVGLPVVDQLGCPGNGCVRPNFGSQFDLNLGLLVAF